MALKRSTDNKMIAGVCGGLGKEYEIDPTIIRFVFVITALMGFGLPIIVYIIMALLLKKE